MIQQTELAEVFAKLPDTLASGIVIHLNKGTTVFYKGAATTHAYLIVQGDLIVQNPHPSGETYYISHMAQGAFMCDLEIISGNLLNTTTVIANTDCTLIKFTAEQFLSALKNDSNFLFKVSKKMAGKMYQESYRLGDDLYKQGADKLKVYLVKSFKAQNSNDELVILKTRQVIANEVGVSIKTINRSVKRLKDQTKLSIVGGKIHISLAHYQQLVIDLAD